MKPVDLAILAAVPDEVAPLCESLASSASLDIAGNTFTLHDHRDISLLIGTTGIGKVNAAAFTAAILTRFGPIEVWNIGCAGAYAEGGLRIGDVVITREHICGDEGIMRQGGRTSAGHIGIPLLIRDGRPFFDRFPVEAFKPSRVAETPVDPGRYVADPSSPAREPAPFQHGPPDAFSVEYGPSLTVGMVSGDPETASERFRSCGAMAENMEGSAIAQVCLLFRAPFLECRGISNIAGVRDKAQWNFSQAITHCHAVVRHLLESFSGGDPDPV
ncbi:MAG: hypothetical protein WAW37_09050 [Syntrophobacteraceae bacterium]